MEQFIWHVVPGAFLLAPFVAWAAIDAGTAAVAGVATAIPVAGFLVHQVYRLFRETPDRGSLPIANLMKEEEGITDADEATMLWALRISSNESPNGWLANYQRSITYLYALGASWLGALTGAVLTALLFVVPHLSEGAPDVASRQGLVFLLLAIAEILACVVFFTRHRQVWNFLCTKQKLMYPLIPHRLSGHIDKHRESGKHATETTQGG